jgi:hypothetical protein
VGVVRMKNFLSMPKKDVEKSILKQEEYNYAIYFANYAN